MTGRVLVVDDILANVKLLEARLSAEYFDVLTAYSGPEALERLQAERIDVVLLDVMMPGMDGFEVCRRIKSSPKTMHVPVIMVTALDQPADKRASSSLTLAKMSSTTRTRPVIGHPQLPTQPNAQASPRYRRTVSRKVPIEIGLEM